MVSEREVVALLHRADWTKLALAGTVTVAEPVVDSVISVRSDEPPSGPWRRKNTEPPPPPPSWLPGDAPPWASRWLEKQMREARRAAGSVWDFEPNGQGAACALAVAPGRRFRVDGADGAWALGCDGARLWHWIPNRPPGASVSFGLTGSGDRPRPPYEALLAPSLPTSWTRRGCSALIWISPAAPRSRWTDGERTGSWPGTGKPRGR